MTPLQKVAVNQLLNCTLGETARRLFIQSKVLELLAYQMESFVERLSGRQERKPCTSISPEEADRIRLARETLKKNMAAPPSLQELSRLVGLNINKLKKGFRIVYDKTPFGCLHSDRMQRAHELLSERNFNVSEVAWEVGYVNVGHFSTAFQKRFGVKPKAFQLECGKRFYSV